MNCGQSPPSFYFGLREVATSLRQIVKDHEMGFFDDHIRKDRRHFAFFKIQFLEQVGSEIFCSVGYGENVVLWNSRVETLQLRYPQPGFRYGSGGNFSEHLVVVRGNFLKHGESAG